MWKPAPIIGREMTMSNKVSVNPGAVNQAFNMGNELPQQNGSNLAAMRQQIQQIRAENPDDAGGAQPSYMLPSYFDQTRKENKFDDLMTMI